MASMIPVLKARGQRRAVATLLFSSWFQQSKKKAGREGLPEPE